MIAPLLWFKSAVGVATLIAASGAFAGYSWWLYSAGGNSPRKELAEYKLAQAQALQSAKDDAAQLLQEQRNRALAAETVAAKSQTEFNRQMKAKQNDIRKASANLAACLLSDDTVRLLNDAARAATTR